ncbi:alpha/beta fold hydrolase [Streptomyces sp. RerS4]|uniref:alpha/beta hydrolase n=1 Tax=Streptomyces sp. RerS4 TaxID=2942449 RepID=UPI00201C2548|nr:alpha/beta fold hydrolase [Streptomyces sp. RerS4]UQW99579.1 alpha/beta fold hydrolase [Streptomyces sp. RerS4]
MAVRTRVHLVLVHGLFSSAKVWKAFESLITTDPELADWVSVHPFEYDSPFARLRPDRRVAETDDIADQLGTFLETRVGDAERIVLVTHSQGGLIVQRFLARKLWNGEGAELARIKHFTMFACPNTGSGFFLTVRKAVTTLWRNPQEQQLRPFDRAVTEAQRTVLSAVVHGRAFTDQECPIPVRAYGGSADDIVPPVVARGVFPKGGVVTADHFSIVQPKDRTAPSYMAVRGALLEVADGTLPPEDRETRALEPLEPSAPRTPARLSGRPSLPPPGAGDPDLAPFPPPPYGRMEEGQFKGQDRQDLVASLLSGEAGRAGQQVHVLAGLGGSGKSRLALEVADRAQRAGHRVWWVSMPELSLRMRMMARDLGAPSITVDRAWLLGTAMDLLWELLNACPDPWLLIFDNADDPGRLGPRDGQVSDGTGWLRKPRNPGGTVLVTSRVRRPQAWGDWIDVHQVLPLHEDDGAAMLLERTGGIGGTNEEARRLSRQLGGLPLALRHAADVIKAVGERQISLEGGIAIRDFETFRRTFAARVDTAAAPDAADPADDRTETGGRTEGGGRVEGGGQARPDLSELLGREIVEQVCGIALDLLAKRELAQAAPLLKVLACLSISPIPYRRLLAGPALARSPLFPGATPARTTAVLAGLEEFGLVDAYEREGFAERDLAQVLTLHPVVHGVLREDRRVRERPADYYGLAVRLVLNALHLHNPDHPANWPLWAALAPHALEVSRACLLGDFRPADRTVRTEALELARLTARYLIATGLLGPAYDLVLPLVQRCSSFGFDADDREILGLRHEQGRIHLDREQLARAEEVLQRVVRARTALFGEIDADTLASRHKLARAINEQAGREAEAEAMLRSIVEAENKVRGPEHYDTLVVRHTLARTMLALGRHDEAMEEARQILDISRGNHWPPSTPEILRVRETLTHALLRQNRAEEAERVIRDALRDASQPPDSNLVMRFRYTFVLVLLGIRGRTPEAVNELRALVRDLDRVVASEHPLSVQARALLAKTLREMP